MRTVILLSAVLFGCSTNLQKAEETCPDAIGCAYERASVVSIGRCTEISPVTIESIPPEALAEGLSEGFFSMCTFKVREHLKTPGKDTLSILVARPGSEIPPEEFERYASVADKYYFESNHGPSVCVDPFGGVHSSNCKRFVPIIIPHGDVVYFSDNLNISFHVYPYDDETGGYMMKRLEELSSK